MARALVVLFTLLSILPAFAEPTIRPRLRKVTFPLTDRHELSALEASGGFEIVEVAGGRVVALQRTERPDETAWVPVPAGLAVLSEDVDQELAPFSAQGSEGAYHSVAENQSELADWAARFPDLCRVESIGRTFEGRDIWALRITGAADPKTVPRMLIFGLIHAREWASAELPHYIIKKLVNGYAADPAIKKIVDSRAIWVVPVTNPDGLAYSQGQYTMWRKNRSRRGSSVGVDINRNFEVGWGLGSSSSPGSDVYRGPSFASEEETRAVLALAQRERFHVTLSFHAYSELVLYPWGYSEDDPPGKAVLARHGKAMAQANGYTPGSVAQILYVAGGGTDDTLFLRHGCWPFTFELGTQFVPPENQIDPLCAKNWPAVLHLIDALPGLAQTPPPVGVAATASRRLAALEQAWVRSRTALFEDMQGAGGSTVDELLATLAGQVQTDPALAGEIERRARDPRLVGLYTPLVRAIRMR
ncbi:MAG: zinc carboxypeptidase [Candidatus Riflebacteria bacterium]|nr:zinc carboxypeptidase [Candidatus Riflebacteria bacterium]